MHILDGGCIYPFYSRVVTPVLPITTVHLSLTRRDIKAVPLESLSRMLPQPHFTSVLAHTYMQRHTNAEP